MNMSVGRRLSAVGGWVIGAIAFMGFGCGGTAPGSEESSNEGPKNEESDLGASASALILNTDRITMNSQSLWATKGGTDAQAIRSAAGNGNPEGKFRLWLQNDCNISLRTNTGLLLWDAHVTQMDQPSTGACSLTVQSDGNLVGWAHSWSGARAYYATNSVVGGLSSAQLVVQSDGNLVLYHNGSPVRCKFGCPWPFEQGTWGQ